MLTTRLPEYKRRAFRLGLGVLLPSLLGFAYLPLPEDEQLYADLRIGCKWAAITAAIVAQPLIGKSSQVGTERTIGTILGGFCGFFIHTAGTLIFHEENDGLWLAITAGILSACSVIVGYHLKLDTSARLFTITLLLVTFAGDSGEGTARTASVRVTGIVSGVLLMLLLSVLVLPKSATMETFHCMDKALLSLEQLLQVSWSQYLAPLAPLASRDDDDIEVALLVTVEGVEDKCEELLTEIYSHLSAMQESMNSSKSEVLLTRVGRQPLKHIIILPGLPFRKSGGQHLPVPALSAAANAVRRTARTLFTLSQAIEDGLVQELQGVVPGYETKLKQLASSSQAAMHALCEAFPSAPTTTGSSPSSSTVVAFLQHVDSWQALAGRKPGSALDSWSRYRTARANWQMVFDTLVKKNKSQGITPSDNSTEGALVQPPANGSEKKKKKKGKQSAPDLSLMDDAVVQIEWHSMTFLLYQLGQDLVRLEACLKDVATQLP